MAVRGDSETRGGAALLTLAVNNARRYYGHQGGTAMPKKLKSSTITEKPLAPVSPGEMLLEEFLKPLAMTNYRLAKEIGVPPQRIGEIIAGRRAITADTDLRLCRFFGLSEGWWLRLQNHHDLRKAKIEMSATLAKIKPLKRQP
jgi:antitoxin HigA-1